MDNRDWLKRIKAAEFKEAEALLYQFADEKWKQGDKAGYKRGVYETRNGR